MLNKINLANHQVPTRHCLLNVSDKALAAVRCVSTGGRWLAPSCSVQYEIARQYLVTKLVKGIDLNKGWLSTQKNVSPYDRFER